MTDIQNSARGTGYSRLDLQKKGSRWHGSRAHPSESFGTQVPWLVAAWMEAWGKLQIGRLGMEAQL